MSITTALKARREALRDDREAGFTLIELLVVVIIIGILAAIAIPVYLGVQGNAKDSAVKSDLTNAKTAIVSAATDTNGSLPASIDGTTFVATMPSGVTPATVGMTDKGWSKSDNTKTLTYVTDSATAPTKWCVYGLGTTGTKFQITSSAAVSSLASSATTCTLP